jgi:hypothetical protein
MEKDTGCGLVIVNDFEEICMVHQFFWPSPNFLHFKDGKGSIFSNKTYNLEFVGILIPFLIGPEFFINQHVIVKVDNVACFYGWINRKVTNDACASIIVRALHLISAYLACMIHIEHLQRLSTREACIVDRLSRMSTTLPEDKVWLDSFDVDESRLEPLIEWLKLPMEDWTLPMRILSSVMDSCNNLIN